MIQVVTFAVNPFAENVYIVYDADKNAFIVDPGMISDSERNKVDQFITDNGLNLKYILLTHQHADHILSAKYMSDKYHAEILSNNNDSFLGEHLPEQVNMFGLQCKTAPLTTTADLHEGSKLSFGKHDIMVLETPGHSPGGVSFYLKELGGVFVGDSLFAGSIGRTDLYGGDYDQLIRSIREKLLTLPDETVVYTGHGSITTIGDEKLYNPYLK